jgi:hypothetical protein
MAANVKNSTGQPATGFPTYQEDVIYGGQKKTFTFRWQTTRNTPVGTYTVEMTSSVPDDKCDQTNDIPLTTTQTVYVALSPDTCVCRLDNFRVENIVGPNTAVAIKGERLTAFQNWSYTSISECNIQNAGVTNIEDKTRLCHSERSEESLRLSQRPFAGAQGDMLLMCWVVGTPQNAGGDLCDTFLL